MLQKMAGWGMLTGCPEVISGGAEQAAHSRTSAEGPRLLRHAAEAGAFIVLLMVIWGLPSGGAGWAADGGAAAERSGAGGRAAEAGAAAVA